MKIAVVGGGAAGLSAAYLLKKAGYSHVTVFEKDSRLGGKCKTVMLNGRSYELGAVVHRSGAEPLESFIREFKLELVPGIARRPRGTPILFDPHRGRLYPYPRMLEAIIEAIRLRLITGRRQEICCDGHENMTADLSLPLTGWLKMNRLSALERLFAAWLAGFGYGYPDGIPAAYALKFCTPHSIWALVIQGAVGFRNGYQGLWERIGSVLDVRFNHAVQRITRQDRIVVATEGGEFEFDKLILSCDLRAVAPALDLDEEEADLIGRIRSHRYYSLIAEVEDLPPAAFVTPEYGPQFAGELVCWYHRWSDTSVYNIYAIAKEESARKKYTKRLLPVSGSSAESWVAWFAAKAGIIFPACPVAI